MTEQIQKLLDDMAFVRSDCDDLLKVSNAMAQSPDPDKRAAAYEINIGVAKIISSQQEMLKSMKEIILSFKDSYCREENGFGALAE